MAEINKIWVEEVRPSGAKFGHYKKLPEPLVQFLCDFSAIHKIQTWQIRMLAAMLEAYEKAKAQETSVEILPAGSLEMSIKELKLLGKSANYVSFDEFKPGGKIK